MNGSRLLASLNCDGPYGAGLLAACALLIAPALGGRHVEALLRYDRAGLARGEWWRLLTAHVAHLNPHHAVLNALGLVLLWALFARDHRPRDWALILLAAAAAIDAGLWLRDSTVLWYLGSSGVLHGAWAAGARARRHRAEGWLLMALLAAKLTYEQWAGPLPLAGKGVPVIVDAHLYGALGGLAAALALDWAGRAHSEIRRRSGPLGRI